MLPLCATWENRQAIYTPSGTPVVWTYNTLPLPYVVQLDDGQTPYEEAVHDAAAMWNREIGFPVLRKAVGPHDARVFVTSGSASDGGLAATTHSGDVLPESATVQLRAVGNVAEAFFALAHEFGHVLGLADGDSGVMGLMPGDFGERVQWCLPRDEEVKYLRSVYRI